VRDACTVWGYMFEWKRYLDICICMQGNRYARANINAYRLAVITIAHAHHACVLGPGGELTSKPTHQQRCRREDRVFRQMGFGEVG
jgi:hypothetical protein